MKARELKTTIARKGQVARHKIITAAHTRQAAFPPEMKHIPGQTFSAHGEDVLCIAYLLSQGLTYENIQYLDIGAAEPSRLSNTFLLYLRGAKGVLVEPDPVSAEDLRRERPRDIVVEAGVAFGPKRSALYHRFNKSVFNTFSAEQARFVQNQSLSWGEGQQVELIETIKIPLVPLNKIIKKYLSDKAPHFLTVDAEGFDWDILTSLDFNKYLPNVICFEGKPNQHLSDENVLTKYGYTALCRTPDNLIYARNTGL